MISAFGVEHSISKSFVNGKFVRAVDLSAKQTAKVKAGGQYGRAKGMTSNDKKFKSTYKEMKNYAAEQKPGVHWNGVPKYDGGAAATLRFGSKSSGRSVVFGSAGSADVRHLAGHEEQHAKVKRSSYRLHNQIHNDPKKLFREEARADYHSAGHFAKLPDKMTYAQGARAVRADPDKPFKFQRQTNRMLTRNAPNPTPRISNKEALTNIGNAINQHTPMYRLDKPKRARKAFNAYADLHDEMKAKGVTPEYLKRKK